MERHSFPAALQWVFRGFTLTHWRSLEKPANSQEVARLWSGYIADGFGADATQLWKSGSVLERRVERWRGGRGHQSVSLPAILSLPKNKYDTGKAVEAEDLQKDDRGDEDTRG